MEFRDSNKSPEISEDITEFKRRVLERREFRRKKRRQRRMLFTVILVLIGGVTLFSIKGKEKAEVKELVEVNEDVEVNTVIEQANASVDVAYAAEISVDEFDDVGYYEVENQQRYIAYKKENPDMDNAEIVWRVNANLDKEWYTADIPVSGYDDPYIIVNKFYKVPDEYKPPDLVEADGFLMREKTAEAYLMMRQDAEKEGLRMRAVSAYRSVEYQRNLYDRYLSQDSKENVDRYSARAGHSEHHTGMAIDLFGSEEGLRNFINTPEYEWVCENCYKYGFIIRYSADIENITGYEDEPWHIRYIGVEASTDMKNKGIKSLEEYYEKYIKE